MSGINISYTYVAGLIAQAQSAAAASGSGGLAFPYYTPQGGSGDSNIDTQWTTGTSFDTSIPYNSNGTINIQAMLQKLHDILYYSANGDQMDYNSIMDATAYIMNIGAVWGQMSSSDQAQVSGYLNMSVSGVPLINIITQIGIPAVIEGTYYQNDGNQSETLAFAQNFVNELDSISQGCPLLSPLAQYANSLYGPNGSTLEGWMNDPINTYNAQTKNFDEFAFNQALNWETAFSYNSGDAAFFNSWRSLELNDQLSGVTNPFEAYIIIMSILENEGGDLQTTIAGQGNLTNYLSTPMGNNAKEIANAWSAGSFTGSTAQTFYQEMMELSKFAQNSAVSSIAPQIDAIFESLTNPASASQINSTITIDGTSTPITLGQLFQDITTGTSIGINGYVPTWSDMATAMNNLQPSTSNGGSNDNPSFPSQPGYTTLSNMVQQVTNSITSKSSAIGQIMQNDEGVSEKDLTMLQAGFEEFVNTEQAITQNMAQAGS